MRLRRLGRCGGAGDRRPSPSGRAAARARRRRRHRRFAGSGRGAGETACEGLYSCPIYLSLAISMSEVTRILSAIESGDPHAAEELLPLVYAELRKLASAKLAQENPGQTLQATALVHEAYLR